MADQQGMFFSEQELEKMAPWDLEYWRDRGIRIKRAEGKGDLFKSQRQWAIGEWLLVGKAELGIRTLRAEAEEIWKKPWGTLKNYMGMAKEFPKSRRRDFLYWSHHYEVRALPPKEQDKWLDWCVYEKDGKTWVKPKETLKTALKGSAKDTVVKGEIAARAKAYESVGAKVPTEEPGPVQIVFNTRTSEVLRFLLENEQPVHGQKTVEGLVWWLLNRGLKSVDGWTEKGSKLHSALMDALFFRTQRSSDYRRNLKTTVAKQAES